MGYIATLYDPYHLTKSSDSGAKCKNTQVSSLLWCEAECAYMSYGAVMHSILFKTSKPAALEEPELPDSNAINRVMIAIIDEASRIEPNAAVLLRWYVEDPIQQLGGKTASQLVASGRGELVVRFLRRIASVGSPNRFR